MFLINGLNNEKKYTTELLQFVTLDNLSILFPNTVHFI